MGISGGDIARRTAGWGLANLITAVYGSGVSFLSTGSSIDLNGWYALTVLIDKATTFELIG